MLYSLFQHNHQDQIGIHFIYKDILKAEIESLKLFIRQASQGRGQLYSYDMADHHFSFEGAVINRYYTVEMYYYLLAYDILPESIERVIYLDPDILIINSLAYIYDMNLEGNLFAGSEHTLMPSQEVNSIRLKTFADLENLDHYINAGALVMDLKAQREVLNPQEIFDFLNDAHPAAIILPDQDVLNYLYADRTKEIPEEVFNYDARSFIPYYMRNNQWDTDYVMAHTVVIHFCGNQKPWKPYASGRFVTLYRYFQHQAQTLDKELRQQLNIEPASLPE